MLDLGNHAPQKHEETGGLLTENGMKMLAEGVVLFEKNASQQWRLLHENGRGVLW